PARETSRAPAPSGNTMAVAPSASLLSKKARSASTTATQPDGGAESEGGGEAGAAGIWPVAKSRPHPSQNASSAARAAPQFGHVRAGAAGGGAAGAAAGAASAAPQ